MTQTKWIDVNGNLYEGTIETVQNWDGSENDQCAFAIIAIAVVIAILVSINVNL